MKKRKLEQLNSSDSDNDNESSQSDGDNDNESSPSDSNNDNESSSSNNSNNDNESSNSNNSKNDNNDSSESDNQDDIKNKIILNLPVLYKKVNTNGVRLFKVWIEDDTWFSSNGLIKGKQKIIAHKSIGKNIGKSNETNAHQQAIKEANAKWKNMKIVKKYNEDESGKDINKDKGKDDPDNDNNNIALSNLYVPMIATKWEVEGQKIIERLKNDDTINEDESWPIDVQPILESKIKVKIFMLDNDNNDNSEDEDKNSRSNDEMVCINMDTNEPILFSDDLKEELKKLFDTIFKDLGFCLFGYYTAKSKIYFYDFQDQFNCMAWKGRRNILQQINFVDDRDNNYFQLLYFLEPSIVYCHKDLNIVSDYFLNYKNNENENEDEDDINIIGIYLYFQNGTHQSNKKTKQVIIRNKMNEILLRVVDAKFKKERNINTIIWTLNSNATTIGKVKNEKKEKQIKIANKKQKQKQIEIEIEIKEKYQNDDDCDDIWSIWKYGDENKRGNILRSIDVPVEYKTMTKQNQLKFSRLKFSMSHLLFVINK